MMRTWLLGAFFATSTAAAQDTTRVRVSGVVFDSIAMTPLKGAIIQMADAERRDGMRTTETDSLGRFFIDSVPVGRYLLGFIHPVLEILGIEQPTYVVTIREAKPVTANLAIPSAVTMFRHLCGVVDTTKNPGGLMFGRLFDAKTRLPVQSGAILVQWTTISTENHRIEPVAVEVPVPVDSSGHFTTCGLPSRTDLTLIGVSGADSTGPVPLRVGPREVVTRDLFVGANQHITVDRVDSTAVDDAGHATPRKITEQLLRGTARLAGTVRNDHGQPIPGAHVSVADAGLQATTDDQGRFSIRDLPSGTHGVLLRAIGRFPEERPVALFADSAVRMDVSLNSVRAVLDTIHIIGSRAAKERMDFDQRRRSGIGSYITEDEIKKRQPNETTDALWRNLAHGRNGTLAFRVHGRACLPAVYIDRMPVFLFADLKELDDYVRPEEILGMEIYSGENAPMEFHRFGACATLVIWRRR